MAKEKILTACYDAGGAEIVSAYVRAHKNRADFICYVGGPAKIIFKEKKILTISTGDWSTLGIKKIILKHKDVSRVIVGTTRIPPIHVRFLKIARRQGIKTAVYLDHWVNYRERFGYPQKNWRDNLPDQIWVGDRYAYNLAKKQFKPGVKINFVPNLYFKDIKREYNKILRARSVSGGILFISEPMKTFVNNAGRKKIKFSEYDILEKILFTLTKKYKNDIKKKFMIRLHPSEARNKYNTIIKKYKDFLLLTKSNQTNILKDINRAQIIIGGESMALVIAGLCGKKVFSFIPYTEKNCSLPFTYIIKVKEINKLMKVLFPVEKFI